MKKANVYRQIVQTLSEDLSILLHAAKSAHEAATHEENIPDNKYDTLSLEASYVAQGQANRAQEIKAALEVYKKLELKPFDEQTPIRLTALVVLEDDEGEGKVVFIGPEAGGLKLTEEGREVIVITPGSPLGRALFGKCVGDAVAFGRGGGAREYEIVEVC